MHQGPYKSWQEFYEEDAKWAKIQHACIFVAGIFFIFAWALGSLAALAGKQEAKSPSVSEPSHGPRYDRYHRSQSRSVVGN